MSNILKYKDYIATVNFAAEDEVFYGKIEGINDFVTFEGSSVDELKQSFEDSVDDYLETCKELGKKPNKTYKGSFNVRVSSSLHKRVVMLAKSQGVTLNEVVKTALERTVDDNDPLIA